MKDILLAGALVIGGLLLFVLMIALVVAFYGAVIGGLIGAAWLVIKAIVGFAA